MTIGLQENSAANKIGVIVFLICNIRVFFSDLALTSFETHSVNSECVSNKTQIDNVNFESILLLKFE